MERHSFNGDLSSVSSGSYLNSCGPQKGMLLMERALRGCKLGVFLRDISEFI